MQALGTIATAAVLGGTGALLYFAIRVAAKTCGKPEAPPPGPASPRRQSLPGA
ncbi:MAG: hypothetical protein JST11_12535 [Acidobacteria bacterium]|nr:hypothetical protein [Acidobacteriota bacterium]